MDSTFKDPDWALKVGNRIRVRRRILKLTLKETATAAGISAPFLSQVERGLAAPSVRSITGIARALGVQMPYFFDPLGDGRCVHRKEQVQLFCFDGSGTAFARLSRLSAGSRLESLLVHIPPGQKSEVAVSADEEFLFVLTGEISIVLAGQPLTVSAGDSLHYASGAPYGWTNSGTGDAVAIWIGTPGLF